MTPAEATARSERDAARATAEGLRVMRSIDLAIRDAARAEQKEAQAERDTALAEVDHLRRELEEARTERDAARRVAEEILARFSHPGNPGEHCASTGWIPLRQIAAWRTALTPTTTGDDQ